MNVIRIYILLPFYSLINVIVIISNEILPSHRFDVTMFTKPNFFTNSVTSSGFTIVIIKPELFTALRCQRLKAA